VLLFICGLLLGVLFCHMAHCWHHNNKSFGIRPVRPIPPPPPKDYRAEYYTQSVPTVEQVRERIRENKPLSEGGPIKRTIKIKSV
jgi:hypothetical protein